MTRWEPIVDRGPRRGNASRATLAAGSPKPRQLAVLRSGSAVFRVIYSREMARFLVYILEREPHYFVHPVICPLVVCPGPADPERIPPLLSRNGLGLGLGLVEPFSHIGAVYFLAS